MTQVARPATVHERLLIAEGATIGALVGGALLWVLNEYVFRGTTPEWAEGLIDWALPPLLALAGAALGALWPFRGTEGQGQGQGPA